MLDIKYKMSFEIIHSFSKIPLSASVQALVANQNKIVIERVQNLIFDL